MWKKFLTTALALMTCLSVSAASTETTPETTKPVEEKTTAPLPSSVKHLDLVLILDKSGSMYGLESDTIGGFNSMIDKEKELDVDTKVTTVLFNNTVTVLNDRSNIADIKKMTTNDYRVGGSTALLDAVGDTIAKVADMPGITDADHKVIVVIITDGLENASHEYAKATIKQMITDKQKEGWEFVFLGANIDAASEANSIGINKDNAVKYRNTEKGVQQNFAAIAAYTKGVVQNNRTSAWKNEVERDN